MLNSVCKYLFIASSILPALLTLIFMSLIKWSQTGQNYLIMTTLLIIISIVLITATFWIFYHIKIDFPNPTKLSIRNISLSNKDNVYYFLICLYPIIGSDVLISDWIVTAFFCFSLFIYAGFSSSQHLNPIIPLFFGYKLYSAEDISGRTILLLSKDELRRGNYQNLKVKEITAYTYVIEEITDE